MNDTGVKVFFKPKTLHGDVKTKQNYINYFRYLSEDCSSEHLPVDAAVEIDVCVCEDVVYTFVFLGQTSLSLVNFTLKAFIKIFGFLIKHSILKLVVARGNIRLQNNY